MHLDDGTGVGEVGGGGGGGVATVECNSNLNAIEDNASCTAIFASPIWGCLNAEVRCVPECDREPVH